MNRFKEFLRAAEIEDERKGLSGEMLVPDVAAHAGMSLAEARSIADELMGVGLLYSLCKRRDHFLIEREPAMLAQARRRLKSRR